MLFCFVIIHMNAAIRAHWNYLGGVAMKHYAYLKHLKSFHCIPFYSVRIPFLIGVCNILRTVGRS